MDFAYLASQTFGDVALERELLDLFVAQARRLLPDLPAHDAARQAEIAHLLKGAARAIGANSVAAAAETYEQAPTRGHRADDAAYQALARAYEETEVAILAHLSRLRTTRL